MITGEITVSTCYGDANIPVEIYAKGPRLGTVWVRALNNLTPFTKMSHGGPFQDDTAVWSSSHVRNIQIEAEEEQPLMVDLQPAEQVEPEVDRPISVDWFLEMAYEDRTCID